VLIKLNIELLFIYKCTDLSCILDSVY